MGRTARARPTAGRLPPSRGSRHSWGDRCHPAIPLSTGAGHRASRACAFSSEGWRAASHGGQRAHGHVVVRGPPGPGEVRAGGRGGRGLALAIFPRHPSRGGGRRAGVHPPFRRHDGSARALVRPGVERPIKACLLVYGLGQEGKPALRRPEGRKQGAVVGPFQTLPGPRVWLRRRPTTSLATDL